MDKRKIAYFSAEIGLNSEIKTYSGGLGILSGDTLKAMADLSVPTIAITLLYKNGFFKQIIQDKYQHEEKDSWDFQKYLKDTKKQIIVNIQGEDIIVKIWEYILKGNSGSTVPIYFLDTDVKENPEWAQKITKRLYLGNRLHQEIVLGIGGYRALQELGQDEIQRYHMNEGHSSFLTLELYRDLGNKTGVWDIENVKKKCIFTTHTPIPAGHDIFPYTEIHNALVESTSLIPWQIEQLAGYENFNTTKLAMSMSNFTNGVSQKHMEVTKKMFPNHNIHGITNGIHCKTWVSPYFEKIFNEHIPGWDNDYEKLREIFNVDSNLIVDAHNKAKRDLITLCNEKNIVKDIYFSPDKITIGFARRFIKYKDAEFIFQNLEKLKELGKDVQIIFAGKSHSNDTQGKEIMKKIISFADHLRDDISIGFLENYNMDISKVMIAGCDLWLNTPIQPNEASGTSGMKAAVNGCLHFSKLDGWAIEGFEKNGGGYPLSCPEDFYMYLKYFIIPKFRCEYSTTWAHEMKLAIGNSASYFNTHRMVKEYCSKGYKIKGIFFE